MKYVLIALLFVYSVVSCHSPFRTTCTPAQFLNRVNVDRAQYNLDSISVVRILKWSLSNHKGLFESKESFSGTHVIIDTIIYNAGKNKMAVLVIAVNPTSRQIYPDIKHREYYDGTCLIIKKEGGAVAYAWLGPTLTNANNLNKASIDLREIFFCEMGMIRNGASKYFNINDVRFWESDDFQKEFKNAN